MAPPTYEALVASVADMKKELDVYKVKFASYTATDDKDNDDKLDASFLKAQNEVEKEKKDMEATTDEMEKVKDAFKKAEDETDPEKKKESMKKAMEMKDEHDKKAQKYKKAEEVPTENVDKTKEHEAKIAAIVMKKIPLMNKILEATKIIDPTNLAKVEKELTAATLDEVQDRWNTIQPFIAATGLTARTASVNGMPGMVPFQAGLVTGQENPTDIFSASADEVDFSKVSTEDILGMYQ